jgi:tetratricopeptide (TPR) repeat protein
MEFLMLRLITLSGLLSLTFSISNAAAEMPAEIAQAMAMFDHAKTQADYSRALAELEETHKQFPRDPELTFYLGRSLFHDQQLEEADELLSANVKRHPDHAESHYVLGSVKLTRVAEVSLFRKIGTAKAALAAWQRAHELDPTHAESLYGVVEFYYTAPGMAGGDRELGAQELARLETLSQPWAALSQASRAVQAESFAEAEALFEEAIAGIPHRAFPQLMLASAYVRQEKFEEAKFALEAYRARDRTWNDPGIPQMELMAARIYRGLGEQGKALEAINLVMNSNPPFVIREQAEQTREGIEEMVAR